MSTTTAAPAPPFALLAAASVTEPRPGRARSDALELAWDSLAIDVRDTSGEAVQAWRLGPDTRMAIQLSRSTRIIEPGWLMRSLGRETRQEHRLHLELRDLESGRRLRLVAALADPERLEGLPVLDQQGHPLEPDALEHLLVTALALGATVVAAPTGDSAPQRSPASQAAPSIEATVLGLRSERDAQRDALDQLRAEHEQLTAQLEELRRKAQRSLDAERSAELARIQADKDFELWKRRAVETESELRQMLAESERRFAALTAEAPAGMKTLDEHNRLAALDASRLDRLGVRCPACDARGDRIEMVAWSPAMTAAVTNRGVNTSAEGGLVSATVKEKLFVWRSAVCPRCGYTAKFFPAPTDRPSDVPDATAKLVDVRIPELGEAVREATVERWFASPGGRVFADQSLVLLESDKATFEVPSPVEGILHEQLAEPGARVTVGTIIARVRAT